MALSNAILLSGTRVYLASETVQLDEPVTPEVEFSLLITHGSHKLFEHPDDLLVMWDADTLLLKQLQLQHEFSGTYDHESCFLLCVYTHTTFSMMCKGAETSHATRARYIINPV
jgi:hypothetical protein